MKKLIFTAAALSLVFAACGDKKDNEEGEEGGGDVSVCDCINMSEEMFERMEEAEGDEDAMKAIEEEYADIEKKCRDMAEGLSDDEMKELMKEAEECM